jgi:hypothetical protein
VTWVITSDLAGNGVDSKRACDGRAFTPKLGNDCSRWWLANVEVRQNRCKTTSSSSVWCWLTLGGVTMVRQ